MQEMAREMERTTFVKKVITDVPAGEVLEQAQEFFREHGYRAGKAGKPNTVRLMGRAEGALPSVIGEIEVRTTNKGRTIVGLSGYGEGLSERLREFHDRMRAARLAKEARPSAPVAAPRPATRTEEIEEAMLEAQEERGEDYAFNRDRYEGDDKP
ncbi:MAG: hypothetical protein U0841_28700 [Chloroflexia bacterium]